MKNLTKLFMAVVVFAAYSCATDTTNDLGVEFGDGKGGTTLSLSMEAARTHIDKEVSGKYPMYWSDNDVISVNGERSTEIKVSSNKSFATFTIPDNLGETYRIAYPAAGDNQVLFADTQTHTEGTFGDNVTTMYGTCAAGEMTAMHHLTGVLKIGVKGSATLTHAEVSTIDHRPIAGIFDFDFTTGESTPSESATEYINYSFGDSGLQLTSAVQYMHVVVPAGTYDELYVTLFDNNGGVMYATVKADDNNPLVAGQLRTFNKDIEYASIKNDVYVISDKNTLKSFAAAAPTSDKVAVVVADIDMTGEIWTPINGYTKTLRGNGHVIKGLNAPLFGTTSATIIGLHLEDVDITETATPNVGAFARTMVATESVVPFIEHCSASGKINVNCTEYAATSASDIYASFAVGGLVGAVHGVDILDCVSSVNVDVVQVVATSNTTTIHPCIAGIVGYADAFTVGEGDSATATLSNIYRCENSGSIDVAELSTTASKFSAKTVMHIAGVAGYINDNNKDCSIQDITNRGNVTASRYLGNVGTGIVPNTIAGAIGYANTKSGKNIYNYGDVTYTSGKSHTLYIGGVIGKCGTSNVLNDVHNYGNVSLPLGGTPEQTTVAYIYCGGVMGHLATGTKLRNGSNNKPVTVKCLTDKSETASRPYIVGGVVALVDGSVGQCYNNSEGTITCEGTIKHIYNWKDVCIGGVAGLAIGNALTYSENNADISAALTVSGGNVLADGLFAYLETHNRVHIGGVVGLNGNVSKNLVNKGDITVSGSYGALALGGVLGDWNSATNDTNATVYTNEGIITISDNTTIAEKAYIGGVVGSTRGHLYSATNEATGTINIGKVTFSKNAYIGGCVGELLLHETSAKLNTATNSGAINISNGTIFSAVLNLGGCVGYSSKGATIDTATNNGAITLNDGTTLTGWHNIGGVIGRACGTVKFQNLTNNEGGDINIHKVTTKGITMIAGCLCDTETTNGAGEITKAYNSGSITIDADASLVNQVYIGGITARGQCKFTTIENKATGSITVNYLSSGSANYIGGCIARVQGTNSTVTSATNRGAITAIGNTGEKALYLGGIAGDASKKFTTVTNHGAITTTVELTKDDAALQFVGGIVGQIAEAIDTANNYGTVTVSHSTNNIGRRYIAGICPNLKVGGNNLTNHTTATITAAVNKPSYTYLAGIAHGCAASATDVLNQGEIVLNGSTDAMTLVGGVFGDAKGAYAYTRVKNEGAITINATTTGQLSVSGLQADNNAKNQSWTDCYNSGTITLSSTANCSGATYVSGLFARMRNADVVNTFSNCYNSGTILVDEKAKTTHASTFVGGIVGEYGNNATASMITTTTAKDLYNTGAITINNKADNVYVGGFAGKAVAPITKVSVVCNLTAWGLSNVGMITGSERTDTIKATNCHVGGYIDKGVHKEDYDPLIGDNVTKWWSNKITLSPNNYCRYVYGTRPGEDNNETNTIVAGDGCGFITAIDDAEPEQPEL